MERDDRSGARRATPEADALKRYAAARSSDTGLYAVAGAAALTAASFAMAPLMALAIFAPAFMAEAGERALLRRLAVLPDRVLRRPRPRREATLLALLNSLTSATCILALTALGGFAAAPVAAAIALMISLHAAMVHDAAPRLHVLRQCACAVALVGSAALAAWPLPAPWPQAQPAPAGAGVAAVLSAALVTAAASVIYLRLRFRALRRRRDFEALRAARRQAEANSEELVQVMSAAERASLHDPLTGLPNRRFLERRIHEIQQEAARAPMIGPQLPEHSAALLLVDLDGFKGINDTMGHDAGDQVLRHVAGLLRRNVRETDFVARLGGDEFVILCDAGGPEVVAARIIAKVREPIAYGDQTCRVGASVGLAISQPAEANLSDLLTRADLALYAAKGSGRGRAAAFSHSLRQEAVQRRRRADDVLRGLEQDEFEPWYQPQFDARTGQIAGVEAVARWRHPSRGLLAPADFMGSAEEVGVIADLDGCILARALEDRAALVEAGGTPPRISINLGARSLRDARFAEQVSAAALPGGALAFEIRDAPDEGARWSLDLLADLGVEFDIDDFGAGPASVATLIALRPRRVKIDRRFVAPKLETPQREAVVRGIVDLARSLDVEVVAQGVEELADGERLADMGVAVLQGHAYAAPMPWQALTERADIGRGVVDPAAHEGYRRASS
ncbi:MAG: EAL domain-containing protein [Pseudomonadota bacterium]